jgi:hypothetical protein
MIFSSVRVLCVAIKNEIFRDFKNKAINESEYECDYSVDNDKKFCLIS